MWSNLYYEGISSVWPLCSEIRSGYTFEIFETAYYERSYMLWHADPLLGNDREISSYTTAVAK
jgi:hypothetical protein